MNEEISAAAEQVILEAEQETNPEFPERPPFDNQELINSHLLRNTALKRDLMDLVDDVLIYESAKRSMKALIMDAFDQNWFLSNLEKGDKNSSGRIDEMFAAKNSFELQVITSTASMCKSDINNADMANIINVIRRQFNIAILSRAKGPNRERILNKLSSVEQIVTKRSETTPTAKAAEKKRKYGIF